MLLMKQGTELSSYIRQVLTELYWQNVHMMGKEKSIVKPPVFILCLMFLKLCFIPLFSL